jgi:glycine/D-amino acid oxidase-like deaminating enzyme
MLKESNFWLSTLSQPVFPALPLPEKVDVAVIGGGFSGLSAALRLAKAGCCVAVLEAQNMGWGASSRNGGMVLTGMKLGVETLIHSHGLERARRMFALSLDAIDTVERIVHEEKIDCAFSRCGHLETAWKPAHFAGYARAAELLESKFAHKVRILPRAELHTEIGSDLYHGGLLDELSAGINPAQFVAGLAQAAARAGALLHEQTTVQKIERQNSAFVMQTNRGLLRADKVFIGSGGYTGSATPALQKRLLPIGSYVIASAPLSEAQAREVNPHRRMIFDSKHFLYYFRLTPDNRLLFGGRAAFLPETASSVRDSAPILSQAMLAVHPHLKDVPVEYVWGGSLDFALDSMPHAGNLEGLHHAVGYAGHGVAFATHLGSLIADDMLGKNIANPLADLPFPKLPITNGAAWLLPLAGLYYKFLDIVS